MSVFQGTGRGMVGGLGWWLGGGGVKELGFKRVVQGGGRFPEGKCPVV